MCTASKCNNPRELDTTGIWNDFCTDHTCVMPDCNEGRVHDPERLSYDQYCATHLGNMLCSFDGCENHKIRLGQQFEPFCSKHYVPPCFHLGCIYDSKQPSAFCNLHSCQQKECMQEARPGRGRPFCSAHSCSDDGCETLRAYSEIDGHLEINDFCSAHECQKKMCIRHIAPDKPYCTTHCCTKDSCHSERDGHPGFPTLCYDHHEEQIRQQAREELAAEMLAENQRATRRAAAEEAQRQTRERAEHRPHFRRGDVPGYRPGEEYRFSGRDEEVRPQADRYGRPEVPRAGQARSFDEYDDGDRFADDHRQRARRNGIPTPEPEIGGRYRTPY